MKIIAVIVAFLSLLTLNPTVYAAGTTANVSWTLPTQYNDNSVLPVTDIAIVTVSWPDAGGGSVTVPGAATSATVPVACGARNFTVTVTTTATAKYPSSVSPASSPPVLYASGVTCAPKAVTGVQAS